MSESDFKRVAVDYEYYKKLEANTIDQKKPEPDGYCAYWKGTLQNGLLASGLDELELIAHERLDEEAAEDCMNERRGWQIKPVWISEQPPSGWVSVKERLPDESGRYLTYGKIYGPPSTLEFFSNTKAWNVRNEQSWENEIEGITHWQPLPPPPDLEKENEK